MKLPDMLHFPLCSLAIRYTALSNIILCSVAFCVSCTNQSTKQDVPECSATTLEFLPLEPLQGVWVDSDSQSPFMWVRGDSAYYPDNTSMPALIRLSKDSLWLGQEAYLVEEIRKNLLSLQILPGSTLRLLKTQNSEDTVLFMLAPAQPVVYTEKTSRDTVTFCGEHRLHSYVTINPTSRKVVRTSYNAEGMAVDNFYFDNVIHLSVYEGRKCLFRRNIEKTDFSAYVPANFLNQAILSDILFAQTDSKGVHFYAQVCVPDGAACYMIELTVDMEGKLTMTLRDY